MKDPGTQVPHIQIIARRYKQCGAAHLDVSTALRSAQHDGKGKIAMWVYILTNHTNKVLYTGVTKDINRRTFEHRSKAVDGFAEKYNAYKVVYAEEASSAYDAISREKQIKGWSRAKKIALIESINPQWVDLLRDE